MKSAQLICGILIFAPTVLYTLEVWGGWVSGRPQAQLTAMLRLAAEGQPVTSTCHGVPVAVLLPAAAGDVWQLHLDDEQRVGLRRERHGHHCGPAAAAGR